VLPNAFLSAIGFRPPGMYAICESAGDAYRALESVDWPLVMKADGLCGGKGVLVTASRDDARSFVESVMEKARAWRWRQEHAARRGSAMGQELSLIVTC